MKDVQEYYRLSEVAKMLDVSYVTMWRWCNDGRVASVKLPSGQRRIVRSEVERVTNQQERSE